MYNPQTNLLQGIRQAFPLQMFPWDHYFVTMAEADVLDGRSEVLAVKSWFVRQAPFGGSYLLLGGITDALRTINELSLADSDFLAGMEDMGMCPSFINWLEHEKRLRLMVYAPPEGSVFFPNEPIVTVHGCLPHIRLAEGILTEALNFATLSLTKWHRFARTIRPGEGLEFSRRRSQNHLKASLYSVLGGCKRTSNSELRRFFEVWVAGTMGHEYMQSYGDVGTAFRAWLRCQPGKPIGLVDTKQCLEHDFLTWLECVQEFAETIKAANPAIWGWRNDSGDLAYLTIEQYRRFLKHSLAQDPWFRERMRIVLTNELDEYSAQSIIAQIRTQAAAAGMDAEDILRRIIWAAGTKPGTCADQPAIGGVAKLMAADGFACLKLAFDADGRPGLKTSIPGFNKSAIICNADGDIMGVVVYPSHFIVYNGLIWDSVLRVPIKPLMAINLNNPDRRLEVDVYTAVAQQELVYDSHRDDGSWTGKFADQTVAEVQARVSAGVDSLPWTAARLDKPTPVPVFLIPELFDQRQRMIQQGVLREDLLQ